MTKVVNIKLEKYDVKICRSSNGKHHMLNTKVGEPGWLGNPFPMPKYSREDCIALYRKEFIKKLQDSEFRKTVLSLKDKSLGCFCHPLACHGDVIKEYLDCQIIKLGDISF